MSTDFGIDLSGWDLNGKLGLVAALAQSVDEFVGIVTEVQIVISDPDWPDKRSAGHRMWDYVVDAIQNFVAEPSTVQNFVDAIPADATPDQAFGILERLLPDMPKVKDALKWLVSNLDDFLMFILPYILPLILGTKKLGPLQQLFRLPRLRAA